jgi:hypothetical protein
MATLNIYTTKPQREAKARQEFRDAGVKAYVPSERRQWGKSKRYVPTGRQYVFAKGDKPYDAEHIGKKLSGTATPEEVLGMYVRTSKTQRRHAFAIGDTVNIKRGAHAEVTATVVGIIRAQWYEVQVVFFGKTHVVRIRESDLIRLHPST